MNQTQVAEAFFRGEDVGKASHFAIRAFNHQGEKWTILEGYDWACYVLRAPDGSFTYFSGWQGYSRTTSSKHLSNIRGRLPAGTWTSNERAESNHVIANPIPFTVIGKVLA